MKMYMVGGCVRDEILGTPSKDIDFVVVLENGEADGMRPFRFMVISLKASGFDIIEEATKEEFLTARGFFPKDHPVYPGKPADFVLARKEGSYSDGRRPDSVEIGTLLDDLGRRDFTMNAIAKVTEADSDKFSEMYIDPFGGYADIQNKVIRAVGPKNELGWVTARNRLKEDALRAIRALRFSVTKGFQCDGYLWAALQHPDVLEAIVNKISDERIQLELSKMFRFDTVKSIQILNARPLLTEAMFSGDVSLDSTMKTRGRN